MARDPHHGKDTIPKNIPAPRGVDVQKYIEKLQKEGQVKSGSSLESNPHVVRIAAAAASETAWEYSSIHGQNVGVLTEALIIAIKETGDKEIPWRTLVLRAKQLVNVKFPR